MSVNYELRGEVAVISISRPERRNAIDHATATALAEAWRRFDADDDASVAVLWGTEGHFSAGADLRSFDLVDTPGGFLGFTRMTVSKPTIAAIEGACVAGGLEMALWCDIRVAGSSVYFGVFNRRFDVPLVDGGTQRLPRIIGQGRALELILTGRRVDAAEALSLGLVNEVVVDGRALARAVELGAQIASLPQTTVRSDRMAVLEGRGRPIGEGLEIERRHGLASLHGARAGAARFAAGAGRGGSSATDVDPPQAVSGVTSPAPNPEAPPVAPRPRPAPAVPAPEGDGEGPSVVSERASDGYWALPAGGQGQPLLVLHDRWGLTSSVRATADRLAEQGYLVKAIDLLRGELPGSEARSNQMIEQLVPDVVARVLIRAVGDLVEDERALGKGVGVIGLGIGGGLATWLATLDDQVLTCVTFGGYLPWTTTRPLYRRASARFLGHLGADDSRVDAGMAYRLEMELRDLGLDATFYTYRGAGEGFWDQARPEQYRPDQSRLAWDRTRLFLSRSLD